MIINKALKGILWDEELRHDYEEKDLRPNESAISSAMKSFTTYDFDGLIVVAIESPKILSKSLLAERILQERPNSTLALSYSPDGKVSIRRKLGTDIKCDWIVRRLNGEGDSYTAAGVIQSNREGIATDSGKSIIRTAECSKRAMRMRLRSTRN